MRKVLHTVLFLVAMLGGAIWTGLAMADEPLETLPPQRVNGKDGAAMVLIPGGEFLLGTSQEEGAAWLQAHPLDRPGWFANEMPRRTISLDAFYMYVTEVTVAQYRSFCAATGRAMPPEPDWKWQDTHPIVNVTWEDANAYAQWAGAALPTEAQWERAARGGDRRVFPWGDAWPPPPGAGNLADETGKAARSSFHETYIDGYTDGFAAVAPVGSFPANPYGVHDLAGNVWEWCADWYSENAYQEAAATNPCGPEGGRARVARGGAWSGNYPWGYRVAYRNVRYPYARHGLAPVYRGDHALGFRCVVPVAAD